MMQRSPAWDAAIRSSGSMVVLASILYRGAPVLRDLAVVGGSVVQDAKASVRGRCEIRFAEPTLIPSDAGDPLSPLGYEVVVERGVVYRSSVPASSWTSLVAVITENGYALATGTGEVLGFPLTRYSATVGAVVEMKQLGVFPIQRSLIDGRTLVTSISAMDRAQWVKDAMLTDVYPVAAGTPFHTAIRDLIEFCVPGLEYDFAETALVTPQLAFPGYTDGWEHARLMAQSIGMELFMNGFGRVVLRPVQDVRNATPVWTVADGDGQTLTGIGLERDRTDAFNQWTAIGTNSTNTAPYRGVATDLDPASPTYFHGPFGRKPAPPLRTSLIGSSEQALAAAQAKLLAGLGVPRAVTAQAVPNPALEAGDPLLFTETKLGYSEVHLADTLATGLGPGDGQTYTARARQLAA